MVLPVAKLARLSCVFLCSSDLFLERPVQKLTWGLFRLLTRSRKCLISLLSAYKSRELSQKKFLSIFRQSRLDSLDLNVPPPGLASFQDLYSALLSQFEAVSFGDRLFGCWLLLPLQRRYSATMRLAVFGEHVGMLRSLGVTLAQVMRMYPLIVSLVAFACLKIILSKLSIILSFCTWFEALHSYGAVHLAPGGLPASPPSLLPLAGDGDPEALLVSCLICSHRVSRQRFHLLPGCCSAGTELNHPASCS